MVYTDHLMPELHTQEELDRLGPEDRLVAMRRDWDGPAGGLDRPVRKRFEVLLRVPVGGGEALLLRKKSDAPSEVKK
jgi:hypothetical protein